MRNSGPFGFVLFLAITLFLVYHPILAKLSVGLVSPYAKADVTKRLFVTAIDGTLVVTMLVLYRTSESLPYLLVGAAYLLLRDAIAGRSVGKFFCGLVVVNLLTGRPCGDGAAINRNALLLLPGARCRGVFGGGDDRQRPSRAQIGRPVCGHASGRRFRRQGCGDCGSGVVA